MVKLLIITGSDCLVTILSGAELFCLETQMPSYVVCLCITTPVLVVYMCAKKGECAANLTGSNRQIVAPFQNPVHLK